ncbi:MAG: sulfite exporter TauE/SafE family protein, partial [Gammaproteobacteria bacterium]
MSITAAWPLLAASLTLGLAGSLHCVAMCGGIAAA